MKQSYVKFIFFLFLIVALFFLIRCSGLLHYLSLEYVKNKRDIILAYTQEKYALAVVLYILLYIFVAALSIPQAAVLSVVGGYLFGTFFGAMYIILGATIGSTLAFILSRYLLHSFVKEKYAKQLTYFNQSLALRGSVYLLIIRLIPVFPFFIVNILAALTDISLWLFMWTTALGIIPGVVVFACAGQRLSEINTIEDILSFRFWVAILFLVFILLVPLFFKKRFTKHNF
jgi:uncharacterized membrane protein YdjX (TVP38/TMEM64 family)